MILLFACGTPECPDGQKFNLDGLCVEDTSLPQDSEGTTDSPPDTEILDTQTDSPPDSQDSVPAASDWEVMGGEGAVSALLDAFLNNVAADASINWMFANSDLASFKQLLMEQISSVTGGPYAYTGRDMVTVHAGMAITNDHWNFLIGDLLGAIDSLSLAHSADFAGDYPVDRLVRTLSGLHDSIVSDPDGTQVLFNQLGGYGVIGDLVSDILIEVSLDDRINGRFANADLVQLNRLLVEQLCQATGGYCVYSGADMRTVHTGMNISQDEFNAMVEDTLTALDDLNIDYTYPDFSGGLPADTLMLTLAGMQGDIVGH